MGVELTRIIYIKTNLTFEIIEIHVTIVYNYKGTFVFYSKRGGKYEVRRTI